MFRIKVDFQELLSKLENLEFDNITEELIAKHYLEIISKDLEKFESIVKDKISEPLPTKLIGRKRPQNRLWNYLVSGEMKEQFKTAISMYKKSKNIYRISIQVADTSPHSFFTNRGVRNQRGKWVGWFDDITKGDGRDNVRSLNSRLFDLFRDSVFNELILAYTTTRIKARK